MWTARSADTLRLSCGQNAGATSGAIKHRGGALWLTTRDHLLSVRAMRRLSRSDRQFHRSSQPKSRLPAPIGRDPRLRTQCGPMTATGFSSRNGARRACSSPCQLCPKWWQPGWPRSRRRGGRTARSHETLPLSHGITGRRGTWPRSTVMPAMSSPIRSPGSGANSAPGRRARRAPSWRPIWRG